MAGVRRGVGRGGWGWGKKGDQAHEEGRSLPSPFPKHANSTKINNKHTYQVSVVKSTGSLFTSSGAKGKKIKTVFV